MTPVQKVILDYVLRPIPRLLGLIASTTSSQLKENALMADPYIGQVILFAGSYAPEGWAFCNGQILNVTQYQALYALLGNTYGGNAPNTFALPDLSGRVPVGTGTGTSGLPPVDLGTRGGANSVTLSQSNLPSHSHPLNVASAQGSATSPSPANAFLANTDDGSGGSSVSLYGTAPGATASPQAIGPVGGNLPIATQPPYLGLNYIIALTGIWPPRP